MHKTEALERHGVIVPAGPFTRCLGRPMPVVQVDVIAYGVDVIVDQDVSHAGRYHLGRHGLARFQCQPFRVGCAWILDSPGARPVAVEVPHIRFEDIRVMAPHDVHFGGAG